MTKIVGANHLTIGHMTVNVVANHLTIGCITVNFGAFNHRSYDSKCRC